MKLFDYLEMCEKGIELEVTDNVYDVYMYFGNDYDKINENDLWENSLIELSKLLVIKKITRNGVVVNFTEIVESKIEELKKADLFIKNDIDSIMCDMTEIMAGYVSEEWLNEFVKVLSNQ